MAGRREVYWSLRKLLPHDVSRTSSPRQRSTAPRKPVALVTSTIPRAVWILHRELLVQLQEQGYDVCVVSSRDVLLDRLASEAGVRVRPLNMKRDISLGVDLGGLLRWVWVCARERPALLVSATPKASLLSQLAGRLLGVPRRIYYVGGLRLEGEEGGRRKLLSLMEWLTSWAATEVVVNSPSLAQRYRELRLAAPAKIRQTHPGSSHGVDAEHFRPRLADSSVAETLGLKLQHPVIGFVGRLTADKGVDALMGALSRLREEGRPVQLLLVGFQDERDSGEYVARLAATGSHVAVVGDVDDVRPYYALMDVHALPSLREGFPNVVLEASAMGLPTVTTDATGAIDSVRHGETGVIVRAGDPEDLAAGLRTFLDDPSKAAECGAAARAWVESRFRPEAVVRSLLGFGVVPVDAASDFVRGGVQ